MALQPYPASLQVSLFIYFVLHERFCLLFIWGWVFVAANGLFSGRSKQRLLLTVVCGPLVAGHLLLWSMDSGVCGLKESLRMARRLQSVAQWCATQA